MNREQILESAAHLIQQKGYHAASMQDIADAVDHQKASLYHHFSSKQEILLALLDQALDMLIERLSTVVEQQTTPPEKIRQAMAIYLESMEEHDALASVLLLEYRSLAPELHGRHIPRRDRFERLWRDMIRAGQESGAFREGDPAVTARALLGVMNWTITWYRPEGEYSISQISDLYADLFLKGLLRT